MNIIKLKVVLLNQSNSERKKIWDVLRKPFSQKDIGKNNYFAEAITKDGKFFYRVDGTTVEVEDGEYKKVISNPRLYYFSTALKLHFRVLKAKELKLGLNWPVNPAAPIHIFNLEKSNDKL